MKKFLIAILSFLMVVSLAACSSKSSEQSKEKVIKMGIVPGKNNEQLIEDVQPIADYLTQKLGVKVETFTASSYIGVVEGIGSGSVDFGIIPPFSSVLAQKQSGAKALLTAKGVDGKPGYFSEILVRKDSNINSIADLKGKKFAFVDPSSSSGYIYPGAMLVENGFDLSKDITYQFSGGHDKSLQLLLNKDVDAIGTYAGLTKKYKKEFPAGETDVRVLQRGDLVPGIIVTGSSKLDSTIQEKLKQALLDMNNDEKVKEVFSRMFNITGFEEVDQSGYEKLEKTAKIMNVDLEKVK